MLQALVRGDFSLMCEDKGAEISHQFLVVSGKEAFVQNQAAFLRQI